MVGYVPYLFDIGSRGTSLGVESINRAHDRAAEGERFRMQLEEQRRQRKAQERAQKKAEKKARQRQLTTTAIGVGAGIAGGAVLGAALAPGLAATQAATQATTQAALQTGTQAATQAGTQAATQAGIAGGTSLIGTPASMAGTAAASQPLTASGALGTSALSGLPAAGAAAPTAPAISAASMAPAYAAPAGATGSVIPAATPMVSTPMGVIGAGTPTAPSLALTQTGVARAGMFGGMLAPTYSAPAGSLVPAGYLSTAGAGASAGGGASLPAAFTGSTATRVAPIVGGAIGGTAGASIGGSQSPTPSPPSETPMTASSSSPSPVEYQPPPMPRIPSRGEAALTGAALGGLGALSGQNYAGSYFGALQDIPNTAMRSTQFGLNLADRARNLDLAERRTASSEAVNAARTDYYNRRPAPGSTRTGSSEYERMIAIPEDERTPEIKDRIKVLGGRGGGGSASRPLSDDDFMTSLDETMGAIGQFQGAEGGDVEIRHKEMEKFLGSSRLTPAQRAFAIKKFQERFKFAYRKPGGEQY